MMTNRDQLSEWLVAAVIVVILIVNCYSLGVRHGIRDGMKLERFRAVYEQRAVFDIDNQRTNLTRAKPYER
jgi:hypothetical protein